MKYWLMKNEPDAYSMHDLMHDGKCVWEGVRNYQARNHMREMKKGDLVFFYHSNAKPSGIAGIAKVSKESYPDPSQFDESSEYFDARSTALSPRWDAVDLTPVAVFRECITLAELKNNPYFNDMLVTKKGIRLSVQPVSKRHFQKIKQMQSK